jgi:hypothetical protein
MYRLQAGQPTQPRRILPRTSLSWPGPPQQGHGCSPRLDFEYTSGLILTSLFPGKRSADQKPDDGAELDDNHGQFSHLSSRPFS